jgi:hypothetical protein
MIKQLKYARALAMLMGCLALPKAHADNPAIQAAETNIGVGLAGSYFHYHENLGNLSDTESGGLGGFNFNASRLGAGSGHENFYVALIYDFSGGFLPYNGFSQGGAVYDAQDRAFFNHVEIRVGDGFALARNVELIPFLAGGYQNWYRNITGPGGYGEFYQAGLLGAGLKLDVAATSSLVLSVAAEGLAVMRGSIAAPALGLNAGFGTSGEESVRLGADWRLDPRWHVFAGLGITHFGYTGSKLDNGFYEPPSMTVQLRSEIGLKFGF